MKSDIQQFIKVISNREEIGRKTKKTLTHIVHLKLLKIHDIQNSPNCPKKLKDFGWEKIKKTVYRVPTTLNRKKRGSLANSGGQKKRRLPFSVSRPFSKTRKPDQKPQHRGVFKEISLLIMHLMVASFVQTGLS